MTYVIRHPARVDLFADESFEWGPLSRAQIFASEIIAGYFTEPGDVVIPVPDKQPIHPITQTP